MQDAGGQNCSVVGCCWLLDWQATEEAESEREIWTDGLSARNNSGIKDEICTCYSATI